MEDKNLNQEQEIVERDASFDPDPVPEIDMSEDELQDTLLEDSGMNSFQKYVARLDGKKWILAQRVTGALLAVGTCLALFWPANESAQGGFSYSLIIAVLLAIVAPNILEKQSLRKIPVARQTMAITLAILIVIYFLITGFRTGFKFFA